MIKTWQEGALNLSEETHVVSIETMRLMQAEIDELRAYLGDLPQAQAEMMATIKSQRRVLKEAWRALQLPSMKTEAMLRQRDQAIAAIQEVLK